MTNTDKNHEPEQPQPSLLLAQPPQPEQQPPPVPAETAGFNAALVGCCEKMLNEFRVGLITKAEAVLKIDEILSFMDTTEA